MEYTMPTDMYDVSEAAGSSAMDAYETALEGGASPYEAMTSACEAAGEIMTEYGCPPDMIEGMTSAASEGYESAMTANPDMPPMEAFDAAGSSVDSYMEAEYDIPVDMGGMADTAYMDSGMEGDMPPTSGMEGDMPPTSGMEGDMPPTSGMEGDMPPTSEMENDMPPITGMENDMPPMEAMENDMPPMDAMDSGMSADYDPGTLGGDTGSVDIDPSLAQAESYAASEAPSTATSAEDIASATSATEDVPPAGVDEVDTASTPPDPNSDDIVG